MTRTLTLARESLTDLTRDELTAVAAGGHTFPHCQVDLVHKVVQALLTSEYPTRSCTT